MMIESSGTDVSIWWQIGIIDVRCSESDSVLMTEPMDGVGSAKKDPDWFSTGPGRGERVTVSMEVVRELASQKPNPSSGP